MEASFHTDGSRRNEEGNQIIQKGINIMTDNTIREPLSIGAELSSVDIRDYHLANTIAKLPSHFELDTVPVKNQGSMPTCTAHAASIMVEYFNMKQESGGHKTFSTNYIFGRRDVGVDGKGMSLRDALKILKTYGDCPLADAPGNEEYSKARASLELKGLDKLDKIAYPHRISSYFRCESDDEVKTALINHGYVIINMPTYKYCIVDDVYTPTTNKIKGYHAAIIYGWDDTQGWLVQNSWGSKWAGDGRFILPFNYPIVEYWGASDAVIGEGLKTPNRIIRAISLIYNCVANFLNRLIKSMMTRKEN